MKKALQENKNPAVTIIVINYNSGDRLARCLDCLAAQTLTDFETIIVDNASEDSSLGKARASERADIVIKSDRNAGFAAANNLAARKARGKWIALLNPDAYPRPDWLAELMAATERHRDVEAFGSLQLEASRPDHVDGAGDVCTAYGLVYRGGIGRRADDFPEEGECFAPCAAAALYLRETFLELSGFDERFFCYGEDLDFGFRLRNAGGRAIQVNKAVVLHEGSGVSGRRSAFTIYYGHRNRIWLYYKNMPLGLYLLTAPLRAGADAALLIKSAMHGRAVSYMRAMIDGYCGIMKLNQARSKIAAMRRESGADIGRALCWSPLKAFTRGIDLRPVGRQGD